MRTWHTLLPLALVLVFCALGPFLARPKQQEQPKPQLPPRGVFQHGKAVTIGGFSVHMQPKEIADLLLPPIYTRRSSDEQYTCLYLNGQNIEFLDGPRGAWIIDGPSFVQDGHLLVTQGDTEELVVHALGPKHSKGDMVFSHDTYWEYRDKDDVMLVVYFSPMKRVTSVRLAD